jgi:ferritin-like metal-binding protein YciE
MKKMRGLEDLLVDTVKDIYYAEKKLLKAIPKMMKKADSTELKDALENHLEETEGQVEKVEKIFKELGVTPKGKKCHAIEGLIEEGEEVMAENLEPKVRDAGIIVSAQKIEHYEMAAYGSIRTFAEILGFDKVADLAQDILDEEGNADKVLNDIAMSINKEAAEGEEYQFNFGKKASNKKGEWVMKGKE